ncbi:MAG: cysteine desulfurase [Planctomycetota bacterium]|nr:MAG: cysteine desulfurase [Planctomycetota bacterium]
MIYLDHNSTTPLLDEVAAAMAPWQTERFGNPASQHAVGRRARRALEKAREEIGRMLGANLSGSQPDRVLFTSGGTEANNLAMLGSLGGPLMQSPPGEVILSPIEHPSVAAVAELLERRGWTIHRLGVSRDGIVEPQTLDEPLSERTRLVCVMLANNETGVIQPVAEIARRCQAAGVPLHTDAAQIAGKLPVNFRAIGAGTMTIAAHKFHGPLGIGALVIRGDVEIDPLVVGGFQQEGLRGGTESVALAVGMHAALAAWEREQQGRIERMSALRDELEQRLIEGFDGRVVINGASAERLPHTSNVALEGVDRQALVMALDLEGVACSTGSACASGSSEPSPTLVAMGCPADVLAGSVRFSLGATTTHADVVAATEKVLAVAARMRAAGRTVCR